MLCKINRTLTLVIIAFISAFIGHSLYLSIDYHVRPGLYAMNSAPWYTAILVNGILTALIALTLLFAKWLVQYLRKKMNA
ncbi:MAG: hypothetical protein II343_04870 [Clostridia bacterium]|nr:hypothetical protein [Clostridia bacterium]